VIGISQLTLPEKFTGLVVDGVGVLVGVLV
jgi:hypothetical protein